MKKAKRLWVPQNTGKSLAVTCLSLLAIQGCTSSQTAGDKTDKTTTTTTSTTTDASATTTGTTTSTTTATTTGAATTTGTTTGSDKDAKTADGKNATATKPDPKESPAKGTHANGLLNDMPEVAAASQKVDLHKMADIDVICTVKGTPITVGDYKQEFKLREAKVQAMLSASPDLEQQLLAEAAKRNVTLTEDEKKRLVETSHKAEAATGKVIKDFLKENKMTEKQFDDKVLRLGLALKTTASMTRETLLNELVDQELLVLAAKDKGYYSKAFHKYIETKTSPEYKQLIAETGMTAEQAQKQIIDRDLIEMYIQYLKDENGTATDAEVQKVYDEHKNNPALKHGERFRLSQIVIAAPSDSPDQPGIRQQLKAANPKMTDKELDAKAAEMKNIQKKKADDILARIEKGAKFEDQANEFTDDPVNKQARNGGDIGWKEKAALQADFLSKVATLNEGQVYPHVIPTRFGFHLLKLTKKEPAGVIPLSDVKDQIKQELIQNKQVKAVVDWIQTQHRSGVVKLSPEFQKLVGGAAATGAEKPKT